MKVSINFRGSKIEIPGVERCTNKAVGLMFSRREKAGTLLFDFPRPVRWSIHSFFVFYPFVAIWVLDGKVVGCEVVRPFRLFVRPTSRFSQLIEIPINKRNESVVESIVGK
jgi:hypothetical protein